MIPISGLVHGALFAAGSRVLAGEIELSEEGRARLDRGREKIHELSELVGDLSASKPGTWGRFAGRVMDHVCEAGQEYESSSEARNENGFVMYYPAPPACMGELARTCPNEVIFEGDDAAVVVAEIGEGLEVCFILVYETPNQNALFYREDDERSEVAAELSEIFWRDRRAVVLDRSGSVPVVSDVDLDEYHYRGEKLELIDRWARFERERMRRCVLLQGPPGCGKTTLCHHAARELTDRAVIATADCVAQTSLSEWLGVLDLLRPEMLIVDDIDRLGSLRDGDLEAKLAYFEEGMCEIPFVLFTSNDHTKIPAAMRRPGRVDQVVTFDAPEGERAASVVDELAERVGLAVPDEQMPRLIELLGEFSAAHVLEALRRAKVLGWEVSRRDDATFRLQRQYDSANDWLSVHGFRRLQIDLPFLMRDLLERSEAEAAYEDDRQRLIRIELPNGAQLCVEEGDPRRPGRAYFLPDVDGERASFEGIAEAFWSDRQMVLLDAVDRDEVSCREIDQTAHRYYGPLVDYIEQWRAFGERELRRCVLIQGEPGCGKSTFCRHAARELSERTLCITPGFYGLIRCEEWRGLIDLVSPQVVILDDVDRADGRTLERKLRLFEEDYCDVPYVFLTSNDHEKLPDAMRRPGRIDQIIEVEAPEKEVRWRLIGEMASRVGIEEVPEEHLPRLDTILVEQSPAHLLEALRRAEVCGWDTPALEGDTTFALEEPAGDDREPGAAYSDRRAGAS